MNMSHWFQIWNQCDMFIISQDQSALDQ